MALKVVANQPEGVRFRTVRQTASWRSAA